MHKHRLSVEAYEAFYNGDKLNPILVEQYNVEGLPGLLLSPRSFKRHDGHFECCSECFNSLKPSKKDTKIQCPITIE